MLNGICVKNFVSSPLILIAVTGVIFSVTKFQNGTIGIFFNGYYKIGLISVSLGPVIA